MEKEVISLNEGSIRQAETRAVSASWRNTSPKGAGQYPEFYVQGDQNAYPLTRSYVDAIAYTTDGTTRYYDANLRAETMYGIEKWFRVQGTFMGFTDPGGFMTGYEYTYTTFPFTTPTPAGVTLEGLVLVQKSEGDFERAGYPGWPPFETGPLSEAERNAVQVLAHKGIVTEVDVPGVDLAALSAKINAARRPDTNRYELSEDGSWRVIPAGEATEK